MMKKLNKLIKEFIPYVEFWDNAAHCALISLKERINEAERWKNTYMGRQRLIELNNLKTELENIIKNETP